MAFITDYSKRSIAAYNRTRVYQHSGVSQTLRNQTVWFESNELVVKLEDQGFSWLVASKVNALHAGEPHWKPRYYVVRVIDGEWRYSCTDEAVRKYCRDAVEAFELTRAA